MEFRSSRVQGVQGVARKPGCHSHVSRKCCQTHTPKNAIGGVGWSGLVHWIGAMDWWNHLHTERQIYKLVTTSTSMWLLVSTQWFLATSKLTCAATYFEITFCFSMGDATNPKDANIKPLFTNCLATCCYQPVFFINCFSTLFINFLSTFINFLSTFYQLLSTF